MLPSSNPKIFYFTAPTPRQLTYMNSNTPRAISSIVPVDLEMGNCLGSYSDVGAAQSSTHRKQGKIYIRLFPVNSDRVTDDIGCEITLGFFYTWHTPPSFYLRMFGCYGGTPHVGATKLQETVDR